MEIPFVIGSHLAPGDHSTRRTGRRTTPRRSPAGSWSCSAARSRCWPGATPAWPRRTGPYSTAASEAIVAEALRTDTDLPLFVALGAGMTELATAVLTEPRIADRLTAVWIGGPEHPGIGLDHPVPGQVEYNLAIDVPAARAVFDSAVPIWQVPRNTYRQALFSLAELDERVRPLGPLGRRLAESVDGLVAMAEGHGLRVGETYCPGDQPLVLLTALQSAFERTRRRARTSCVPPRASAPRAGNREDRPHGRPMRVYSRLDTRLMFEDMVAKFARFARAS